MILWWFINFWLSNMVARSFVMLNRQRVFSYLRLWRPNPCRCRREPPPTMNATDLHFIKSQLRIYTVDSIGASISRCFNCSTWTAICLNKVFLFIGCQRLFELNETWKSLWKLHHYLFLYHVHVMKATMVLRLWCNIRLLCTSEKK